MKFLPNVFLLFFQIVFLYAQESPLKPEPVFNAKDTVLINIKSLDQSFITDVRYATTNNFTGKKLYPSSNIFLRKVVADSILKANEYFKSLGYKIKIYDGYRPQSVQKIMWEMMPDERYVANPAKGSKHNRGAAVDITLVDKDGKELDMGTEYDDFTDKAFPYSEKINSTARINRKLMFDGMKMFGFTVLASEWWHFDFKNWESFNLVEFPIE